MPGTFIRDIKRTWPSGTPLPAAGIFFFYDPTSDAEYKVAPSQISGGLRLRAYLTLAQAQALRDTSAIVPGQAYVVDFGNDVNGYPQLVLLSGAEDSDNFTQTGELRVNGVTQGLVTVNLGAGTFAPLGALPAGPLTGAQLRPRLRAGTGIDIELDGSDVVITCTVTPTAALPRPAAPTAGIVDDTANTFSVQAVAGFASYVEYVYYSPDSGGVQPLVAPVGYQSGNRITLSGLTGSYPVGSVGIAVAASTNRPQGPFCLNADPFTGTGTPPSTAPTVTGFSPASAAAGASVTLTGTNFTGATAVLFNGTAASSFQVLNATTATAIVPANATSGPLSVATSAGTGTSTASFTVAAPNRIPVADAGQDITIQLPTSRVALMGTGSDPDAGDSIASQAWRFVTGPAGVVPTGVPATTQNVVVGNLTTAGIYQFGYRTTDTHGAQSVEDYVVVTVQAASVTNPKGYQSTYSTTYPAAA